MLELTLDFSLNCWKIVEALKESNNKTIRVGLIPLWHNRLKTRMCSIPSSSQREKIYKHVCAIFNIFINLLSILLNYIPLLLLKCQTWTKYQMREKCNRSSIWLNLELSGRSNWSTWLYQSENKEGKHNITNYCHALSLLSSTGCSLK